MEEDWWQQTIEGIERVQIGSELELLENHCMKSSVSGEKLNID